MRRAALNGLKLHWRARHLSMSGSSARPRGLPGECGTLEGFPTGDILVTLGPGEALPRAIREEMEAAFGAGFGRVRVHIGLAAQRIAEVLGAEAFTIGNHVAIRRGRFPPDSSLGSELLRHELAHTLEADGREDRIDGWWTTMWNSGTHTYLLWGRQFDVIVGHGSTVKTHEIITKEALDYVGGYGEGARKILDHWVGQIDHWKTDRGHPLSELASRRSRPGSTQQDFPELSAIVQSAHGVIQAESLLHAYGGPTYAPSAAAIGMTSSVEVEPPRLSGGGVIGDLLGQAVSSFNNGSHRHAVRLLAISLHTIQDFYSHKVWLRGTDTVHPSPGGPSPLVDLRAQARTERLPNNMSIMEDDPALDPRRVLRARDRTSEQLRAFVSRLSPAKRATLSASILENEEPQRSIRGPGHIGPLF